MLEQAARGNSQFGALLGSVRALDSQKKKRAKRPNDLTHMLAQAGSQFAPRAKCQRLLVLNAYR